MTSGTWDVVIIGSGFGGSVCALRAAQAGMRTAVLERGARMTEEAWGDLACGDQPLLHRSWRPGLIQRGGIRGLMAISGNAVGGTSQLYTAATVRPQAEIFDSGWPAGWRLERLEPYLDRVEGVISPSTVRCELSRTRLLEAAGRAMGASARRLPLAMEWPSDVQRIACAPDIEPSENWRTALVAWLRGGRVARKRTLDRTYLAQAEAAGAEVHPLHEVTRIESRNGGYLLGLRRWMRTSWVTDTISTRRIVVSAGTLNTVRLLLSCRDEFRTLPKLSRAVGRKFFTNGDFGGLLVVPREDLSLDSGPAVTAWIDLWQSDRMYLMETGFLPVMQSWLGRAADLLRSPRTARRECLTKLWSFGVMGLGEGENELKMDRDGQLWFFRGRGGEGFARRTIERLRELSTAVGARLLIPPKILLGRRAITVHPLGGACMSDSPDSGAVDSCGEVFGYPGMFVADGSILPSATGAAPSMTIAALAEHVSAGLLRRG